eukprot:10761497-Karenia_brevis.AAC.1
MMRAISACTCTVNRASAWRSRREVGEAAPVTPPEQLLLQTDRNIIRNVAKQEWHDLLRSMDPEIGED